MAQLAHADARLHVTITGIGGKVLLGPRAEVHRGENVKGLKRQLPDCREGAWRLLLDGRELLDGEPLASACGTGTEHEMTAVVVSLLGTELARLTADTQEWKASLMQVDEQWLGACVSAHDDAKRRRRDEDIHVYRQAMARLLQQIEDIAIADCRRCAMDGKSSSTVHLDNLQAYELGSKFYFTRSKPIRADPVLRGWYFSNHGDALDPCDVPEDMELKRPMFTNVGDLNQEAGLDHSRIFINALALELVQRFEQQGLRVSPGSGWGVLQLSWGEEETAEERDEYEKWYDEAVAASGPPGSADRRVLAVRKRPAAER